MDLIKCRTLSGFLGSNFADTNSRSQCCLIVRSPGSSKAGQQSTHNSVSRHNKGFFRGLKHLKPNQKRNLLFTVNATAEVGKVEKRLSDSADNVLNKIEGAVVNGKAHRSLMLDFKSKDIPQVNGFSGPATGYGQKQTIVDFLRGKNILITGATGFLAKVLVEKILREQPKVGHIYLVIQPRAELTAERRLECQVISSKVFDVLRGKHKAEYSDFMESKVTAVEGNMTKSGFGMSSSILEELSEKVDVVVNSAATTTFDERYDVAMSINTLGAKNVLDFAKKCKGVQLLLHVSTAYTNGTRVGPTAERPFVMGDSIAKELSGDRNAPGVIVQEEIALIQKTLQEAKKDASLEEVDKRDAIVTKRMVDLGMQRAQMFGWQDTYVFTKAMGEMMISEYRGDLPVAIVRPSIVESSLSEPLNGWMEGIRMADPILLAYGKGQMDGFLADTEGWLDLVPVDFVINAMLAMLPKHANKAELTVYHVATSVCNPVYLKEVTAATTEHFLKYPMMGKDKKPIKNPPMELFQSPLVFQLKMVMKYQLPLLFQNFMANVSNDRNGSSMVRKRSNLMLKTFEQLCYLAKLYRPYTFYKCRFDASNTLQLFSELSEEDRKRFNFNLNKIDWHHYLVNIHLPGLRKYVLKGRGSN